MDTTIRPELDAKDIIARIMEEMEEVIGLIHRPGRPDVTRPVPASPEGAQDCGRAAPDRI
ncbi:hypothetical protein [Enterovirga sp.]|uniref:hypothetical protein n=1 Tax=Enterovirga sp. TaxID=2026350 RepID=UPI00262E9065|nr:hypothetical protein [Enterovirga sp.]MDB5591696.1 hypothetical protein [Enterovirga sp.]